MSQTKLPTFEIQPGNEAITPQRNQTYPRESQSRLAPVLHVINGEHYSGAERVQDLLALRLPEFGYEVSFACVKAGQFAYHRKSKEAALHWAAMRGRFDLRVVRRLVQLIRDHDYQIVHAHTPRTLMVSRLASAWAKRAAGLPRSQSHFARLHARLGELHQRLD